MDMDMDPQMMQGEPEGDEQGQGGYCIEILVSADGQITVSVESEQEEMAEHDGEPQGTPVEGIKGAIEMVMDIYKNGGQVADAAAGESAFDAGYNEDQSGGSMQSELGKRFA